MSHIDLVKSPKKGLGKEEGKAKHEMGLSQLCFYISQREKKMQEADQKMLEKIDLDASFGVRMSKVRSYYRVFM